MKKNYNGKRNKIKTKANYFRDSVHNDDNNVESIYKNVNNISNEKLFSTKNILSLIAIIISLFSLVLFLVFKFSEMPIEKFNNSVVPELQFEFTKKMFLGEDQFSVPFQLLNKSQMNAYDIHLFGDLQLSDINLLNGNQEYREPIQSINYFTIPKLLSNETAIETEIIKDVDLKVTKNETDEKYSTSSEKLALFFKTNENNIINKSFRLKVYILYKNSVNQCFKLQIEMNTSLDVITTEKKLNVNMSPNMVCPQPITENEFNSTFKERETLCDNKKKYKFYDFLEINPNDNNSIFIHTFTNLSYTSIQGLLVEYKYLDKSSNTLLTSHFYYKSIIFPYDEKKYKLTLKDDIDNKIAEQIFRLEITYYFIGELINPHEVKTIAKFQEGKNTGNMLFEKKAIRHITDEYYDKLIADTIVNTNVIVTSE